MNYYSPLLAILLSSLFSTTAFSQLPVSVSLYIEEAEEAFFDGHYEQADAYIKEFREYIESPSNQRLFHLRGFDYTVMKGFNHLLAAQSELARDGKRVKYELRRAESLLAERRTLYMNRGQDAVVFWMATAFLDFLKGDECHSPEMFLNRDNNGNVIVPFADVLDDKVDPLIEVMKSLQQRGKKAAVHYDNAARIVEHFVFPDTLGQNAQAGEMSQNGVSQQDHGLRLYQRLLVSRAREAIASNDQRAVALVKGDAYATRAEEMLQRNSWWKQFISPNAETPVSYKDFEQADVGDRMRNDPAAGGGGHIQNFGIAQQGGDGSDVKRVLSEKDRIELKRLWAHALHDWLQVQLVRAEIEAAVSIQNGDKLSDTDKATEVYDTAEAILQGQFEPSHPMVMDVLASKVRWRVARVSGAVEAGGPEVRVDAVVAECRNVLFDILKLRTFDQYVTKRENVELLFTELRVLELLFGLHKKNGNFLNKRVLGEMRDRVMKNIDEIAKVLDENNF